MENKYYLVKYLTNTAGQDGSSVAVYDTLEKAQVAYHNTLASFHNASDVLYAIVKIEDAVYGNLQAREIVDHRPEPNEAEEVDD